MKCVLQLMQTFLFVMVDPPMNEYLPLNFNTLLIICMEFQCLARKQIINYCLNKATVHITYEYYILYLVMIHLYFIHLLHYCFRCLD